MRFPLLFLCAAIVVSRAEDEKKSENSDLPTITSLQPFVFAAGSTNKATLKGKNLGDNATFQFNGCAATITGKFAPIKEDKPEKKDDKKKGGDEQQVEIEFSLPDNAPGGTNLTLIAHALNADSKPQPIFIVARGKLIEEKEPNGGFKEAQAVESGKCISGNFSQTTDVDVFKVHAKSGDTLKAEVFSARLIGNLDTSITIYDAKKTIIASNDDTVGLDPAVTFKATEDSDYFIALTAVADVAAKTTPSYVLQISIAP
jgi:hypothetical protein